MSARAAAVALAAAVGGALLAPAVPFADETPAPPTAALETASPSAQVGKALKLDSSASTAGASPIVGHVWDLDGNGSFETDTGTKPTVELKPAAAGPLTVRVRVVDTGGQSSDADLDLDVTAAPKALVDTSAAVLDGNSGNEGGAGGAEPAAATGDQQDEPDTPSPSGSVAEPVSAPSESPAPGEPTAPEPTAPERVDAEPAAPNMTSAPSLVPRRALAARASAQGKTQPVATTVHAAAAGSVTIKDFKFG